MTIMIRKEIYIEPQQELLLKQLAEEKVFVDFCLEEWITL